MELVLLLQVATDYIADLSRPGALTSGQHGNRLSNNCQRQHCCSSVWWCTALWENAPCLFLLLRLCSNLLLHACHLLSVCVAKLICFSCSIKLTWLLRAALNWYRANVQLEQFGDTKPRPAPLLRCPVMGIWSCRDQGVLEEQMKASARFKLYA